jgi:uncharacterized 2Fe-2S/4Fe-4S cluster protein (DUF4445 family)
MWKNWLIACAGAAGPALEGGVTRMGMTAGPGVIDKIAIDPDTGEFTIHTIEDKPPRGICGSGVIDLAAQLFLGGMIDIRGKFLPAQCGRRLKEIDGLVHLTVVPADQSGTGSDLTISQADMDRHRFGSHHQPGRHGQPHSIQSRHVHHPGDHHHLGGHGTRGYKTFLCGRHLRLLH